ncbi:type I polyketide synthase [Pseudonocardia sp. ICBG1293]|uniref:type I polyketide synthase n=1 Tax=Pseudonocardia sp. ICBG1293 TaxID=2844382 RepID=UPI001CCD0070|nr:type I polyketide synthase [Pseudonocardia sp. ICBG1293]
MNETAQRTGPPIAVIGVSALLPGETGPGGFWRTVVSGTDHVTDVPPTHWLVADHYDPDPAAPDKSYAHRGAFLSPVPFDPLAFGIPPRAIEATDTSQLLAMVAAEQLLSSLGPDGLSSVDRERTSVILGTSSLELLTTMGARIQRSVWLDAMRESGIGEAEAEAVCDRIAARYVPWQEATLPGLLSNVVAGRVAHRFDLHGSNYTTDAACASSLAAVSSAVNELAVGQADLVVTGGVDTLNDPVMYTCFSKTPALSPTGDCRPFADDADGMILGEGIVMFALRRLADAERDGDRIMAVIRGIGTASDGRGGAIYAPRAGGQARALRRAYESAGYGPETVELVEAHGTGTVAGDAAEFAALRTVFTESGRTGTGWCALGSVKSQVGHTKHTAGAAGLLKAVLALQHRVLPPTIKVDRPNPRLGIEDSPFYLNTRARPWVSDGSHPRRAGVSSFGFGGTDFHVTLEEHVAAPGAVRPARLRASSSEAVLLAAASPAALVAEARSRAGEARDLVALARRSHTAFDPGAPCRLGLVASSTADLAAELRAAADRIESAPEVSFDGPGGTVYGAATADRGRVAFLFSGQGSQYVGMGAELAMLFPEALERWDAVAAAHGTGDEPLHRVVFPPPAFSDEDRAAQRARLTRTEWAQPALAAQSLATLGLLERLGVRPDVVGGHSFGELVALHAAGCVDAQTLVELARRRGELMRDAADVPGAMAALVGSVDEARELAAATGSDELWVANHNAPSQVVVSGSATAVEAFERAAAEAGRTVRRLEASGAFHSPLVAGAAVPFRRALRDATVAAPLLPVYACADATVYPDDPDAVRDGLARQLEVPVRFVDQIEAMYADGVRTFVEIGANATLTRFTGEILAGREHRAVGLDRASATGVDAVHEALVRLAVGGVGVDLAALWSSYEPLKEDHGVDARTPAMSVELLGANYGKPYPRTEEAPPARPAAAPPSRPATPAPPAGPPAAAPTHPVADAPTRPAAATPTRPVPGVPDGPAPAPSTGPAPAPLPVAVRAAAVEPHHPSGPHRGASEAAGGVEWLRVLQETQRQAGAAHAAYQRAMAESHLAFLRLSETALAGLAGSPAPSPVSSPALPQAAWAPEPEPYAWSEPAPGTAAGSDPAPRPVPASPPVPAPEAMPAPEVMPEPPAAHPAAGTAPAEHAEPAVPAGPRPGSGPVPEVTGPGSAVSVGVGSVGVEGLLGVVADKTGYPVDVLDVGMELESDLGIDSIKRVEILSAARERFGPFAEVDPAELGAARTLGDVAALLGVGSSPDAPGTGATAGDERAAEPVGPAPAPQPAPASTAGPRRLTVRPAPVPAAGTALPGLTAGDVVVTGEPEALVSRLAEELTAHGVDARSAVSVPPGVHGVVHLAGLGTGDALGTAWSAFSRAREFAATRAPGAGVFVTVQDTGGDFGTTGVTAPRPGGGVAALTRTAAREWPGTGVKALDVDTAGRSADEVARLVATELLTGGAATDVGLSEAGRAVLETVELPPPALPVDPRIGPSSVIVASGGGRGVTAAALVALAQRCSPRIVLLGRTPLTEEPAAFRHAQDEDAVRRAVVEQLRGAGSVPSPRSIRTGTDGVLAVREIRATLRALEAAGSPARYVVADVTDPAAVRDALAGVRAEWGPVTGVVHGAGVLADKYIVDKTDEQFGTVLDTKVGGLRALLAAVEDDPLDLLCVFSSVAACDGNAGQSDYAVANEIATALAAAEGLRRPGCLVRSIAWGPWDGGMVDAALADRFRAAGIRPMTLADGARAFVDEVLGEHEPLCVVRTDGRPATARAVGGELTPSVRGLPVLADHAVAGTPVLPLALMIEWLIGAARGVPGASGVGLADLEVLSKIAFDGPDGGPGTLRLTVGGEPGGPVRLGIEGRRPHARAVVDEAPARPETPWEVFDGLRPLGRDTYDGHVLFHGPAFRSIVGFDGRNRAGASGTLAGTSRFGWPEADRHTDPAAVDGALQLATLWAEGVLGTAVLPMGVSGFHCPVPGAVPDTATARVRGGPVGASEARCDVRVSDPDGRVLFELRGVRLVARPDDAPSD